MYILSHVTSGGVAGVLTAETILQHTHPLVFLPHPASPPPLTRVQSRTYFLNSSNHSLTSVRAAAGAVSFQTETQLALKNENVSQGWKLSPLQVSGRSQIVPAELGLTRLFWAGHKGKQWHWSGTPLLEGKLLALGSQHWWYICKQAQSWCKYLQYKLWSC